MAASPSAEKLTSMDNKRNFSREVKLQWAGSLEKEISPGRGGAFFLTSLFIELIDSMENSNAERRTNPFVTPSVVHRPPVRRPPVFQIHDHERLSKLRISSPRSISIGWKRVVARRSNTVCILPKIQRQYAGDETRCSTD
jgi:hypothetical protein